MELSSAEGASRFLGLTQRSVSEDLGCRRGEFSRKHYGSVELLISSDADGAIQRAGRFRVENGSSGENTDYAPATWHRTDVHLENPEHHTRWYLKYFLGKVHQNYIGTDAERNPFFLSVVLSDQNNKRIPQYHSILWRKTGTQKICLPYSPTKTLSVKSILSAMSLEKFEKSPREIFHPEIQKDLLVLEEQEGSVNFKFGVLYAKDGQLTDDEMFSNDDTTGTHSIYTVFQGHEIMFHVSTMLPYSRENKQQVERKRHIGNDIVTIVFQEGEESSSAFKPSMIRSHFTHIFALVRYNKQNDCYRLKIFSEESVPLFGPPLPSPPVFTNHQEFRNFVLVKLINGEKATLETPTFSQKRQRTLDMLIRSLYQDMTPDLHKVNNMLNRRSFSDVLPESPKSTRKKEEARQAEFVRLGQALKLKTTVKGDTTANLATTGFCKKEPWESQSFCSNFPHEVVCADSWGQSLLVSTDVGILLIDEGQPSVQVFDKTLQIKQMHVLETLDLLIARTDKGKDSRLLVFRLSAVQKDIETKQMIRSKYDCRENKLERTKGCHLYAINTHHGSELRIVVAIRNKLLLVTKKYNPHSTLSSTSLLSSPESPVEEFQYIREICLSDPPVVMTLVDGPTGDSDNMICVAYRHQFDLVNESTGESYRLHHIETNRVNFVAAIDVYEDGEAGLLLCYNYVCQYRKVYPFSGGSPLVQPSAYDFHFSWNQVPYAVVCAFPYVLAFTTDSIEIRLVVNGNLVHTAVVPELQLVASRSDIYFKATAAVSGSSDSSSKEMSSKSSPQTPTAYEKPEFSPPSLEGEVPCKNLYKIPLSNLVGRSIERPLKSPLASKVITTTTSSGIASLPVMHSLSLSRVEMKEIASRTRKELLGLLDEPIPKTESAQKLKKVSRRQSDPKQGAVRSTSSDRIISSSFEGYSERHQVSTSSDPDTLANREESSPSSNPFQLISLYDEDIIDLK
ncbi:GTPase-activating Rap/Ran-GAP domain-like protein 3 isoform X3 [Malurus melanocephalus]|uniref:GTPase-activating Rap/Ran-GAP domain-like protein 3 isoform X3 n=1 Tax=Malurus melanocephalus TaxID=175006 RepID=UPI002548FCEE|nr:GTPase-activating Rap/Ran-GAP domain-like protein 3 isoform X3 [Malurus melanocephalus]